MTLRPAPASSAPDASHALPGLAANADVKMTSVLADIDTSRPYSVVPSMAALNADHAQSGHVNASTYGPTMMFNGLNVTEVDQSGAPEHTVNHVAT